MKQFVIAILCLALAVPTLAAEVETEAGTKSLLFDLDGLSDVGVDKFDGGLGLRWFVKDGLAVRSSIDYSSSSQETDPSVHGGTAYTDGESSRDAFDISVVLEKRLAAHGPVSAYWGVGGGFGMQDYSMRSPVPVDPAPGTALQSDIESTTWSALGVLGFEYALMNGVSLGGEYRLRYQTRSEETTRVYQEDEGDQMTDTTTDSLGLSTGSLYLSMSF